MIWTDIDCRPFLGRTAYGLYLTSLLMKTLSLSDVSGLDIIPICLRMFLWNAAVLND